MNRAPGSSASTYLRWEEERVKALLLEPETLLEDQAYSEWIRQQGGLNNIYNMLRGLPLSEKQRKTLKILLDKPGASLQEYALMLHVSVATFVRYRSSLLRSLAAVLNAHLLERPTTAGEEDTLRARTNLPTPYLPIIGREEELRTIRSLLLQENVRLLTITGPGGIGKTRLAIQAAADLSPHFQDGVFLVSLGTLAEADLVASTIAQSLNIKAENHVGYEVLKEHLRNKHLLLVLDNFEQVIDAAPLLHRLLSDAPRLKILVTSRNILHLYGEFEFNVPPLAIPDLERLPSPEALAQSPSVSLFLTRARMVQSNFEITPENARAIAEICVHLEGVPLAIELAAARIKLFSPTALLKELNHALTVLSDRNVDVLPRHQSIHDTIDWSYRLLSADEQSLYAHLGVFSGGFTLEAAQAIWSTSSRAASTSIIIELLASLIDKSMLQRQTTINNEPRFSLLEILRNYALERLRVSGQEETARRRHLYYYRDFVEALEAEGGAAITPAWLHRLDVEHNNLRTALRWAIDSGDYESALRIAGAIWRFWQIHGHVEEGQRWLNTILEGSEGDVSLARCKALWGAGWLGMVSGALDVARLRFEEGVETARRLNEQRYYGLCLLGIGAIERALGAFDQAQHAFEECLSTFQALEDWENVAWAWEHMGVNALESGNFEQAKFYFSRSREAFQRLEQKWAHAEALMFLGHTALQQEDYAQAQHFYQQALTLYESLGDQTQIVSLKLYLGAALFGQGQHMEAMALYRENLGRAHDLKDYWGIAWGIERAAEVAAHAGDTEAAARLWGAANAVRSFSGMLWPPGFRNTYTEQRFLSLESTLGHERWQQAWDEGNALSLNEAVAEALKALSP